MPVSDPNEIPVGLRRVSHRFERWRSGHKSRLPIPNALWKAAVHAAREHGVFRAAKTLRLDYSKLKRMMQAGVPPRVRMAPTSFVELTASDGIAMAECVIELEGSRGKMRIHWKGAMPPDLAGLSRVLWESA